MPKGTAGNRNQQSGESRTKRKEKKKAGNLFQFNQRPFQNNSLLYFPSHVNTLTGPSSTKPLYLLFCFSSHHFPSSLSSFLSLGLYLYTHWLNTHGVPETTTDQATEASTNISESCLLFPRINFLQQSCDAVETKAIPLLSPLFVSPNLHSSSPPRQEDNIRFHVGFTEKNGSPRPNIATKLLSQICFRSNSCLQIIPNEDLSPYESP